MSGQEKKAQVSEENGEGLEDESSGLDYLNNGNRPDEPSREYADEVNKKKAKEWVEKESEVRRVFINNRSRDKKLENDSAYDGIYLYKPGVELPSLYQFANQTVLGRLRRCESSSLPST